MYKHTQFGKAIVIPMLIAVVLFFYTAITLQDPVFTLGTALLLLATGLFSTLTVIVDDHLRFKFGPGLIQRNIPLKNIASCKPVMNSFWMGWGIHYTPHGWLYNVSGWESVEISLKNGKTFRLGTDEPERLCNVLRERIKG